MRKTCRQFYIFALLIAGGIMTQSTTVKVMLKAIPNLIVPPLRPDYHKGVMGRIGILGGSEDYTGAPFYAAKAALSFGADLVYVFCAKQAAIPIKSYSPDAMVTAFYDADDDSTDQLRLSDEKVEALGQRIVNDFLPRLHALVVGPGLGRGELAQRVTRVIIRGAIHKNIPMVIDADGLFLVGKNLAILRDCTRCVLTPNAVEFKRLVESALAFFRDTNVDADTNVPTEKEGNISALQSECIETQLSALSRLLQVTILLKGQTDLITSPRTSPSDSTSTSTSPSPSTISQQQATTRNTVYAVEEPAALRRCGGLGDVLAGSLGLALHWTSTSSGLVGDYALPDSASDSSGFGNVVINGSRTVAVAVAVDGSSVDSALSREREREREREKEQEQDRVIWACLLASTVTRRASVSAFTAKGRAMCAVDVIGSISSAVEALEEREEE